MTSARKTPPSSPGGSVLAGRASTGLQRAQPIIAAPAVRDPSSITLLPGRDSGSQADHARSRSASGSVTGAAHPFGCTRQKARPTIVITRALGGRRRSSRTHVGSRTRGKLQDRRSPGPLSARTRSVGIATPAAQRDRIPPRAGSRAQLNLEPAGRQLALAVRHRYELRPAPYASWRSACGADPPTTPGHRPRPWRSAERTAYGAGWRRVSWARVHYWLQLSRGDDGEVLVSWVEHTDQAAEDAGVAVELDSFSASPAAVIPPPASAGSVRRVAVMVASASPRCGRAL